MKLVIAPDSFKGTLSASAAARIMARAARTELGEQSSILMCPIADGGEGTASVIAEVSGYTSTIDAVDPLGRPLTVDVVTLPDGTVVCDMASCCGLGRLAIHERDPVRCSTRGLGTMVQNILDRGCKRLIIGLGGSATVDGGAGFLSELGAVFSDDQGRALQPYGCDLNRVVAVDLFGVDRRLSQVEIIAACDVSNPMTGPDGAARIFGPQKGASPEQCQLLEHRLTRLGSVYEQACGKPIREIPGSGAAGGLGAALAMIGADLRMGIDVVLFTIGFDQLIAGANLVITGEGRFDQQTLSGKALLGVARWCRRQNVPVVAIVGSRDPTVRPEAAGLLAVFAATTDRTDKLHVSSAEAELEDVCRQVFRMIKWASVGGEIDEGIRDQETTS